jgi:hypothetical protein
MTAPPAFASAQEASEMAEDYWMALARDVPFANYDTDPLIAQAAADLSGFSDFSGPKVGGAVTPATTFRGPTPGDLAGPYLSQFLWLAVPYGSMTITQQYPTLAARIDFMTTYADWQTIQDGQPPSSTTTGAPPRYIATGRDLAAYVHGDYTYQTYLNACLILLGLHAPLDAGNPYISSRTQVGFATFGAPHALDLVGRVANAALKAAWYQKWLVHRRVRPEAFGGAVHNTVTGAASYPISSDLLRTTASPTSALGAVFARYGTYLLPMAYPEGCPLHPSYPAGHAIIAGACVTVLKAFFDETFILPNPVVASADGSTLSPYTDTAPLTVGGELNKLASNVSLGRDFAGVHWRSDGIEGLQLGEAVAIGILGDERGTFTESFSGFSLTKFDGTTITV